MSIKYLTSLSISSGSLTVRATDTFGNTIAGYRGKVKFTSTDAKAGLPATYSFTASRPGTFLYEAGGTVDGTRQVAMGLAKEVT